MIEIGTVTPGNEGRAQAAEEGVDHDETSPIAMPSAFSTSFMDSFTKVARS
jgi:hypothetical protein